MKPYSISAVFILIGCSIALLASSASNWNNETVFRGFNIMCPILREQVMVNAWDGIPTLSEKVRDKTSHLLRWENLLVAKLDRDVRGTGSAIENDTLDDSSVTLLPPQPVSFSSMEPKPKQQPT